MTTTTVANHEPELTYVYLANAWGGLSDNPVAVFDDETIAKAYVVKQKEVNYLAMETQVKPADNRLTLTALRNNLKAILNNDELQGYDLGNEWLRYQIDESNSGDCFSVNTPFTNYIGDNFCLYVTLKDNQVSIDDDGYNIDEWLMSGFTTKDIGKLNAQAKHTIQKVVDAYKGLTVVESDMLSLPVPLNSNLLASYLMDFIQAVITLDGLLRIAWRKRDVKNHQA